MPHSVMIPEEKEPLPEVLFFCVSITLAPSVLFPWRDI